MRFISLISGGKDGFYAAKKCIENGNELLGFLYIKSSRGIIDSYMYQTIGYDIVELYKNNLSVPLWISESNMYSKNVNLKYERTEKDEVEDLYNILKHLKTHIDFEAVSTGAIASEYQYNRVKSVCDRLNLESLSPLWQKDQKKLIEEMINSGIKARIVKIAHPLLTKKFIGMYLEDLYEYIKEDYFKDMNCCGEGGEFETICEDFIFFKRKICITNYEIVTDDIPPKFNSNYYMKVLNYCFVDK